STRGAAGRTTLTCRAYLCANAITRAEYPPELSRLILEKFSHDEHVRLLRLVAASKLKFERFASRFHDELARGAEETRRRTICRRCRLHRRQHPRARTVVRPVIV